MKLILHNISIQYSTFRLRKKVKREEVDHRVKGSIGEKIQLDNGKMSRPLFGVEQRGKMFVFHLARHYSFLEHTHSLKC